MFVNFFSFFSNLMKSDVIKQTKITTPKKNKINPVMDKLCPKNANNKIPNVRFRVIKIHFNNAINILCGLFLFSIVLITILNKNINPQN